VRILLFQKSLQTANETKKVTAITANTEIMATISGRRRLNREKPLSVEIFGNVVMVLRSKAEIFGERMTKR
jgi:hypothetical protein